MNKKTIFFAILLVLALVIFLKKEFFLEKIKTLTAGEGVQKEETLNIVLNEDTADLSPTSIDLNSAIRTANIYEGLVTFDRNLRITPALALSWGSLSPTLWEFKLRKGVLFHNQSPFSAKNVIESFNESKKSSQLAPYVGTIKEMRAVDDFTLQVETHEPDPLLLSKLTRLYIHLPDNTGTGPYKIREWIQGENVALIAFKDYWGKAPRYLNVDYRVMSNRAERKKNFENGKIDILVAVPKEQALELPQEQLKTRFGLEVNFLMFKLDHPILKEKKVREAIRTLFDPSKIEAIGNQFVRSANQFVAPGVYGYNDRIPTFVFDEKKKAKDLFGKRLEKINFNYLESYNTLSEYLIKQLKEVGFSVIKNPVPPEKLLSLIQNNKADLFLIGWQAEDGDAGGFLNAFIHSQGEFNNGRYKNETVDALIEASRKELDPLKRLAMLQEIMQKIDEDLIGIPLFGSSRLYAIKPGTVWEPRTDGLVLAAEIE